MAVVATDAIILQVFPYGDTSRILKLLTRDYGVRSAMAKGAVRPRSRFSGVLEPFTEGTASLYLKDSRELQTLSGFELIRARQQLGNDLIRFGGASLMAEIVLRTASEEAQPLLFARLRDALDHLVDAPPDAVEAAVLMEAWSLTAVLGFAPSLDECVSCSRTLDATEDTRFSYGAGGVLCEDCRAAGGGSALPAHARAALGRMVDGETVTLGETAGHWSLLQRYLDHHVLEGAALRSLSFLDATRRI